MQCRGGPWPRWGLRWFHGALRGTRPPPSPLSMLQDGPVPGEWDILNGLDFPWLLQEIPSDLPCPQLLNPVWAISSLLKDGENLQPLQGWGETGRRLALLSPCPSPVLGSHSGRPSAFPSCRQDPWPCLLCPQRVCFLRAVRQKDPPGPEHQRASPGAPTGHSAQA